MNVHLLHHAAAFPPPILPPDADAVARQACALIDGGRAAEAIPLLVAASEQFPLDGRLVHLTGLALERVSQRAPAIGAYYHALELDPQDASMHASLATALLAEHQLSAARHHAEEAFRLRPSAAHATTLSCVLIEQGLLDRALAVTGQGLATARPCAELLVNRSIALEGLRRPAEALRAGRAAWALARTPVVEHHLATLLLSQGQLTPEAWQLYEARLRLPGVRPLSPRAPYWRGESLAGRTVLLHAEQGLGDTIQFVRYVPLLAALGAKVVLVVQPALRRLLQDVPGAASVLSVGDPWPAFDVFAPLLSLPRLFGTTLETIPPPLDLGLAAPAPEGALRVGFAWAGSPRFVEDRKRSIAPAAMARLAATPGVAAFSLQLPPPNEAADTPAGMSELLAGVQDMADTAARLAGLDLVITVDTAVAHLAASMGKPTWLLSRFRGCWRWLEHRADSPWYPALRLYRQERPNDWAGVLDRVGRDLVQAVECGLGEGAALL